MDKKGLFEENIPIEVTALRLHNVWKWYEFWEMIILWQLLWAWKGLYLLVGNGFPSAANCNILDLFALNRCVHHHARQARIDLKKAIKTETLWENSMETASSDFVAISPPTKKKKCFAFTPIDCTFFFLVKDFTYALAYADTIKASHKSEMFWMAAAKEIITCNIQMVLVHLAH